MKRAVLLSLVLVSFAGCGLGSQHSHLTSPVEVPENKGTPEENAYVASIQSDMQLSFDELGIPVDLTHIPIVIVGKGMVIPHELYRLLPTYQ